MQRIFKVTALKIKTAITITNDRIQLLVSLDDLGEGTAVLTFLIFANARDFPESFRGSGLMDCERV